MKVILTPDEAVQAIQKNCYPAATVEIENLAVSKPQSTIPITALAAAARRFDFKGSEKIAAIKAVRETATRHGFFIGLAESKFFVESLTLTSGY